MRPHKIQKNDGNSEINLLGLTVRGVVNLEVLMNLMFHLDNGLMHTGWKNSGSG